MWKRSNVCSKCVLIGRGLNQRLCKQVWKCDKILFNFEGESPKVRDDSEEVPPVPMPNTEVKVFHAENTYLATGWKDR